MLWCFDAFVQLFYQYIMKFYGTPLLVSKKYRRVSADIGRVLNIDWGGVSRNAVLSQVKYIDDFKFEDFEIVGYNPQKAIKMQMAV